jgi:hypothetical protein
MHHVNANYGGPAYNNMDITYVSQECFPNQGRGILGGGNKGQSAQLLPLSKGD